MTKKDETSVQHEQQMLLPFKRTDSHKYPEGSFRRAESVRKAVSDTLKSCPLSPDQIADEMTRLTGEKVSKSTIANWSAESKSNYRIPLQLAAAFCVATNDNRVLQAAFYGTKFNILNDTDMVFFEIGKAVEEKRERDAMLKESRNRLNSLRAQGKI
jgi:hypothetical protein